MRATPAGAIGALLAGTLAFAPPAAAEAGPALRVTRDALAASLDCAGGVDAASRDPVLLIHGTALSAGTNFDWNYERALTAEERPYCVVDLSDLGMDDIQVSAEHVVHALRTMADRSGRRVDVVGYSQGGMISRWALKFWPDTRDLVDDVVGIAPSNHGTLVADAACLPACAPSFWQQRSGSEFLATLNAGRETYAGIDYTQIYSLTDEIVVPSESSSSLRTGHGDISNMAVQDICPGHIADHLAMGTIDPVAYAAALDALDHPGPADVERIDRAACVAGLMPGVDPTELPARFVQLNAELAATVATYPPVLAEPTLRGYSRN